MRSTPFKTPSPLRFLSTFAINTCTAISISPSVSPLRCGVTMTLGCVNSAWLSGRGSGSVTSIAAPNRGFVLLSSAASSSSDLIRSPRPMLTKTASGLRSSVRQLSYQAAGKRKTDRASWRRACTGSGACWASSRQSRRTPSRKPRGTRATWSSSIFRAGRPLCRRYREQRTGRIISFCSHSCWRRHAHCCPAWPCQRCWRRRCACRGL